MTQPRQPRQAYPAWQGGLWDATLVSRSSEPARVPGLQRQAGPLTATMPAAQRPPQRRPGAPVPSPSPSSHSARGSPSLALARGHIWSLMPPASLSLPLSCSAVSSSFLVHVPSLTAPLLTIIASFPFHSQVPCLAAYAMHKRSAVFPSRRRMMAPPPIDPFHFVFVNRLRPRTQSSPPRRPLPELGWSSDVETLEPTGANWGKPDKMPLDAGQSREILWVVNYHFVRSAGSRDRDCSRARDGTAMTALPARDRRVECKSSDAARVIPPKDGPEASPYSAPNILSSFSSVASVPASYSPGGCLRPVPRSGGLRRKPGEVACSGKHSKQRKWVSRGRVSVVASAVTAVSLCRLRYGAAPVAPRWTTSRLGGSLQQRSGEEKSSLELSGAFPGRYHLGERLAVVHLLASQTSLCLMIAPSHPDPPSPSSLVSRRPGSGRAAACCCCCCFASLPPMSQR